MQFYQAVTSARPTYNSTWRTSSPY